MNETLTVQAEKQPQGLTARAVREMSDDALRIQVAELIGWKYVNPNDWKSYLSQHGYYEKVGGTNAGMILKIYAFPHDLPNYPRGLNAMHEAEKALDDKQHKRFREELRYITGCGASTTAELEKDNRAYQSATARQRAEAFLLTMSPVSEREKPNMVSVQPKANEPVSAARGAVKGEGEK